MGPGNWISAHRVSRLYRVPPQWCLIPRADADEFDRDNWDVPARYLFRGISQGFLDSLIHLRPNVAGDYDLWTEVLLFQLGGGQL